MFAEKLLGLVTAADHNSTYKMATAMALMQVTHEQGVGAPDTLPTDRVAEVVIDLYRRHAGQPTPLRQMNREVQESRILSAVQLQSGCFYCGEALPKDDGRCRGDRRAVHDQTASMPSSPNVFSCRAVIVR